MTTRQKYWLYFLIFYSSLHLIRDVLQDTGVKVFLSTILVKKSSNPVISTILWQSLNTYIIAVVEIILSLVCLRKNRFGHIGYFTIVIALITLLAWTYYWFYL